MTNRYAHIRHLVELREAVSRNPEMADQHIYNTIVENLPTAHSQLYRWMCSTYTGKASTEIVMREWGYSNGYASTLLNELWQFGLLDRRASDHHPKFFTYQVKIEAGD